MSAISLKIRIPEKNAVKTIQFDPSTLVYEACHLITDKIAEVNHGLGSVKDYGLFLVDEDPKKGVWLEAGRSLEYYMLRSGDILEYKRKMRTLRVRMLDGSVKTVLIDESQPVSNLMVVICTKIGITNHDEFSLVRNFPDEGPYSTGTLTIRRREKERTLDYKMEQLKKKLKTDDDLDWVDHAKTLREQGIDPDEETLLLRRKFFFSDHNVDSRDPVQLNLLYVQARNAIIAGSHPVTLQEAAAFAGLQCQIQFGDFVESKHKPGFLDLKEFLPKDYAKNKGVEKRVNSEHRKQVGLSELEAKTRYVQCARSLKTYGVTFFLVKEKMKGKNKLVPRLLGVTKDSVLRLDEKTKEIVKTWPLTTVKRWAASPNSFTLDFGDYSDSYYSVQTMEGEQISQLIAGYIDIILKRKKAKDHFGIEGDEGSTMIEDSVSPYKATILQHQTAQKAKQPETSHVYLPTVIKTVEPKPIETGYITSTATQVKSMTHVGQTPKVTTSRPEISVQTAEAQRAFISNLDKGRKAVRDAEKDLDDLEAGWVPSGPKKQVTFDLKKKALNAQLSAAAAATAHMIQLTSADEENFDYPALANAVQTVAFNLPEIARDTKILAKLMEDEPRGDELIDAARRLCKAFSDLLNAAEPGKSVPRQSLLNAASRVGEATHDLLACIKDPEYDHETEDILLSLAKAVANAAASLVLKGKDVAATVEDPAAQSRVISAATETALATGQLVATAKVVSPTIENPVCQRQITQASKEVARSVEHIVRVTQDSGADPKLIGDLKAAAAEVARALNDLLNHVRSIGDRRSARSVQERETAETEAVDTIYTATDRIFESQGDPSEMIRQAKILAKATVQLINDLKGQAEAVPDSDQQKRLIAAARLLADATARLVDAAKGCKSHPTEPQYHTAIKHAAEDLRVATADTATKKVRLDTSSIDARLERKFEPTYEEINQGPSDVQVNASETTFSAKITKLEQISAFSELKESRSSEKEVTVFRGSPDVLQKHSAFKSTPLEIHERHGPPGDHPPPVPPPPAQMMLDYRPEGINNNISPEEQERNAIVMQELQSRAKGTQACTHAASTVSGIIGDLETTMMFATAGTLNPENEHETFADHRENIFKTAKALVEDTKTLVAGAASSQEQLAVAAENAVITMVNLAEVVKQGAASLGSTNSEAQVLLINAVKDVANALGELIHATKNAAGKSVNDPSMSYLKEAAKVMIVNATSLLKTVRTVEDEHQRGTLALESTIEAIGQELRAYDSPEVPLKKSSPEDLVRVTKPVTLATAKAVAAGTSGKQDDIIVAANMGRKAIFDVLTTAKQAAFTTDSFELRNRVKECGRACALYYRQLLQMVHQFVQRPSGATNEEKQMLVSMSRTIATAVTEIATAAELLKGGEGWVDPEDPTVIAETELLGAASSIDAAAKKLASLQPRVTSIRVPDEDMNFDEMILEAAKSIAAATAALVRAASAAQRELIATGRMSARPASSSDDGQWSEGLISAARHVAAATHSLVEAANALVQGQASEERLISAAKQVASSTAQLLVACKVKADSTSQGMRRLQSAGNAVKKATENLVKAAQKAIEHEEEQNIVLSRRRVSGIAQEISFREAILKKERELAEAREKLAAVRRAKYRRPGEPVDPGNY